MGCSISVAIIPEIFYVQVLCSDATSGRLSTIVGVLANGKWVDWSGEKWFDVVEWDE
jgi:hypothetical protein